MITPRRVGRWPGHKITKNCCAPFIHSFIVDEWETTNLTPPAHRDKTAMNGAQHSILPYHRGGQTNDRATRLDQDFRSSYV